MEAHHVDQYLLPDRKSSIDEEWAKKKWQYVNLLSKGAIPSKSRRDAGYIKMYIRTLERLHDRVGKILNESLLRRSKQLWFSLGLNEG